MKISKLHSFTSIKSLFLYAFIKNYKKNQKRNKLMGRRGKPKILKDVTITGLADKGRAVGRYDEKVVFVEKAVPGDVVDVRVMKKKSGYDIGTAIEYHTVSPDRIEPFCKHFEDCGGCSWQNLAYPTQLFHKENTVKNAMTRIGKIEVGEMLPILPAVETTYYRNKMEYTFSNKRWLSEKEIESEAEFANRKALGFHKPGGFNKIIDINHCFLQGEPSNAIRNGLRDFAIEHDYSFYDVRAQKGFLRNLLMRITTTGEVMVILSVFENDEAAIKHLLDYLQETFPSITSLFYVVNSKRNDFILDLDFHLYSGKDFITENLGDVTFKIGPKSFFQTNSRQAVALYDKIVDFADMQGTENVYDLYTGIGSIALYVAQKCRHVVGIEEIEAAIKDANVNAELNKIENTTFYAGDVKDILTDDFADKHGKPDIVITDPPRAGMHPKVVDILLELAAPKIIYVSCNPATQARDLNLMKDEYRVAKMQPVDMFPHTYHIENIALLELI
jgi:23S rRNA (uracil1939-C5)-methyltransferase